MNPNIKPTERFSVEGLIDPDNYTAGDVSTNWIDMKELGYLSALVAVGDMASTSTVDAKFEQATSAAGAGAKDVAGSDIIQMTEAGGDDNTQAAINLSESDLDIANGFRYARLTVTVAAAASDAGAVVLGFDANYFPKTHASSVAQVDGVATS